MTNDPMPAREATASALRRDIDYGGALVHAGDWSHDGRDRLTSMVEIDTGQSRYVLTIRVTFEPGTAKPSHVAVAERLAGG